MSINEATITIGDKTLSCPVIEGSEGELGIDISKLRAETGAITLDPGLGNTGACTSAITFIDGDKGILRYRGIPIEAFQEHPNFVEVAWLVIFGRLPTPKELDSFSQQLDDNAHLHENMKHQFQGFPIDAPPMAVMSGMLNSLACFHPQFLEPDDISDEEFTELAARLLSKVRTIAAYAHRHSKGRPFLYGSQPELLRQLLAHDVFATLQTIYCRPRNRSRSELLLILHADHEQNCSTSTVRVVGSSKAISLPPAPPGKRPVGATPWRCQCRGFRNAQSNPPRRHDPSPIIKIGKGQNRSI